MNTYSKPRIEKNSLIIDVLDYSIEIHLSNTQIALELEIDKCKGLLSNPKLLTPYSISVLRSRIYVLQEIIKVMKVYGAENLSYVPYDKLTDLTL